MLCLYTLGIIYKCYMYTLYIVYTDYSIFMYIRSTVPLTYTNSLETRVFVNSSRLYWKHRTKKMLYIYHLSPLHVSVLPLYAFSFCLKFKNECFIFHK